MKILTFHTVLPERPADSLFLYAQPTVDEFESQVRYLREHCAPLSLDELLRVVQGRPAPRRAVLVTLDDGFKHSELAAEVLARHAVPSVLFLAVQYVDEHRWPWYLALDWLIEQSRRREVEWRGARYPLGLLSQRKIFRERFKTLYLAAPETDRAPLLAELEATLGSRLPQRLPLSRRFLDWPEAARIARDDPYMEIGSHGVTHHDMTTLGDEALEHEMSASALRIEEMTGQRPRALSYPDGRHDARVRAAAARHYRVAFALRRDARFDDPLRLPRLPGLAGDAAAARRVLSPQWGLRQALWDWRMRLGWI